MALDTDQVLRLQIAINLVAWGSLAFVFVAPRLAALDTRRALRLWIAPQMFRVVGTTLLVAGVTGPGLPDGFREQVATGDLATSVLAILTFAALARPGRLGIGLAAATTVVGGADMIRNLATGMQLHAAAELHGAWFIVAMMVPLMLVAHLGAARRILRRATWASAPILG